MVLALVSSFLAGQIQGSVIIIFIAFVYLFFILLLGVKYFGLTSSGSKRWLDLYFMNLQPSELMKIGLRLINESKR